MTRVALVGHSQLPHSLEVEGADIEIFRAPGGRVDEFYDDERMSDVLKEEWDLVIVWLGSNDIDYDTNTGQLVSELLDVCETIVNACQAVVKICLIEPRFYPDGYVGHEDYKKIQRSVNRKLLKAGYGTLHFHTQGYVNEIDDDGVHFTPQGQHMVRNKLRTAIQGFVESDEDSTSDTDSDTTSDSD